MLDRIECQRILERCVELSRANEVRVALSQDDSAHLRFARNSPSTSGVAETLTLSVTSTFGTRRGTARGNQLDPHSVEGLVRRAEEVAKRSPEDPEHVPELGPQEYAAVDADGGEDLEARLSAMSAGAGRCMEDARKAGLIGAGFVQVAESVRALGTSAGLFGYHHASSGTFSETVRTPDGTGSGWASCASDTAAGLDFAGTSGVAIEKSRRSASPQLLEPGDHPAILEPACVANLLRLLLGSMGARSADEGRSAFSAADGGTRLGEALFPEHVDVRSDPAAAEVPTTPWSGDGLPHRATAWIERGRVANLSSGRFWAKEKGREPLASPPNAVMAGGTKSLDELIRTTERGVLVTNFWYMRGVDPRTLLYTGLTRDGVFWVENGEIVRPLNNFRWNDSPIRAFKNALELSTPSRVGGRGGRSRNYLVPAMRLSAFGFSSVSEAV